MSTLLAIFFLNFDVFLLTSYYMIIYIYISLDAHIHRYVLYIHIL